jgi:hypothetical protein
MPNKLKSMKMLGTRRIKNIRKKYIKHINFELLQFYGADKKDLK